MNIARLPALALAAALWLASALLLLRVGLAAVLGGAETLPIIGPLLTNPDADNRIAPIAILLLYGWVLIALAVRAWLVWREHAATSDLVSLIGGRIDVKQLMSVAEGTRAGARARLVAAGSQGRGNLQELLPGAAATDAVALETSYGRLHVYAWILPVLGFIGTAIAMISSIRGFADALHETSDITVLISRLSQTVIPGLAAAFGATVLALSAALVTYLCTVSLQLWEQEALQANDAACLDFLSRTLRPGQAGGGSDPALVSTMQLILSELKKIVSAGEEFRTAVAQLNAAAESIGTSAAELQTAAQTLEASAAQPYYVTITRGGQP